MANKELPVGLFLDTEKSCDIKWLVKKSCDAGIRGRTSHLFHTGESGGEDPSETKRVVSGTPQGSVISLIHFTIVIFYFIHFIYLFFCSKKKTDSKGFKLYGKTPGKG